MQIAKQFISDRQNFLEKFTDNLFVHVDDDKLEVILCKYKPAFLDFISQAMGERWRL